MCRQCEGWGEVTCPDCEDRPQLHRQMDLFLPQFGGCETCDSDEMIQCPGCQGRGTVEMSKALLSLEQDSDDGREGVVSV